MSTRVTYARRGAKRQRRNTRDSSEDSDSGTPQHTAPPGTPSKRLQVEVVIPPSPYTKSPSKSPLKSPSKPRIGSLEKRPTPSSPSKTPVVELVARKGPITYSATKSLLRESRSSKDALHEDDVLPTFYSPNRRGKSTMVASRLKSTDSEDPLDVIDRTPSSASKAGGSTLPQESPSRRELHPKPSSRRETASTVGSSMHISSEDSLMKRRRVVATRNRIMPEEPAATSIPRAKAEKISRERLRTPSPLPQPSRSSVKPASTQKLRHSAPLKASASLPAAAASSSMSSAPETPLRRTQTEPRGGAFSDLFKFAGSSAHRSPLQPQPTVPVAKRMLARTRTETVPDTGTEALQSLLATSRGSGEISRTNSAQDVLREIQFADDSTRPQAVPLAQTGSSSSMRTYTGYSRSFLSERHPDGLDALDIPVPESYSDLRARWGVDYSDPDPRPPSPSPPPDIPVSSSSGKGKAKAKANDIPKRRPDLAPNMMNDVRSITELRTKGEARRFLDEVGYLFEGMVADAGIAVRRGSALEIVTKLCDTDFARRARATDFLHRAWSAFRTAGAGDGDKILDAILVVFAALVSQTQSDLEELAHEDGFVQVMCTLLDTVGRGRDPVAALRSGMSEMEFKRAGLSKPDRLSLSTLQSILVKKFSMRTSALSDTTPPLRQLVSFTLLSVPPARLPRRHFPALHCSLLAELTLMPKRISAYSAGLPLLPDNADGPQLAHAEYCLSAFDGFLLGRWADTEDRVPLCDAVINGEQQGELCTGLVALCDTSHILLQTSQEEDATALASRCLETALRVLINLSHDNHPWCELLLANIRTVPLMVALVAAYNATQPPSVDDTTTKGVEDQDIDMDMAEDEAHERAFDRLCLALGLLTNLVQAADTAKDVIGQTSLNPACPVSRHCAQGCHCTSRIDALDILVQLYLRTRMSTAEGDVMLRGHLAVLLGLLMRSNANATALLARLPGATRRIRLDALIAHIAEFIGLYESFMDRVAHNGSQEDESITEKQTERRRSGEEVARDVIVALEGLRDR